MPLRSKVYLTGAVFLAGICLTLVYQRLNANLRVVLEPSIVELVEQPVTNKQLNVDFVLTNLSNRDVFVQRAGTSCGCVSLVTRNMATLKSPILMKAGEIMPWRAIVSTDGRVGEDIQQVYFDVVDGSGKEKRLIGTIRLNVREGWIANPYTVEFRGVELGKKYERLIQILNVNGPSDTVIDRVENSDNDDLRVTLLPIETTVYSGESLGDNEQNSSTLNLGKNIGSLKVELAPSEKRSESARQESLIVYSKDDRLPPLRIQVNIAFQPPSHRLIPERLVVQLPSFPVLERHIHCVFASTVTSLSLAEKPSFTEVTFRDPVGNAQEIEIKIHCDDLKAGDYAIRFRIVDDSSKQLTLPIHVFNRGDAKLPATARDGYTG